MRDFFASRGFWSIDLRSKFSEFFKSFNVNKNDNNV